MKTGMTHTGTVVHLARLDLFATQRTGTDLFVPGCSGANRRTVTYLGIIGDEESHPATCHRCQVWKRKLEWNKARAAERTTK